MVVKRKTVCRSIVQLNDICCFTRILTKVTGILPDSGLGIYKNVKCTKNQ